MSSDCSDYGSDISDDILDAIIEPATTGNFVTPKRAPLTAFHNSALYTPLTSSPSRPCRTPAVARALKTSSSTGSREKINVENLPISPPKSSQSRAQTRLLGRFRFQTPSKPDPISQSTNNSPPSSPPERSIAPVPRSSQPQHSSSQEPEPMSTPTPAQLPFPGLYRFTFGIHRGKTIEEVPERYIAFLKMKGLLSKNPELGNAVREVEGRRMSWKDNWATGRKVGIELLRERQISLSAGATEPTQQNLGNTVAPSSPAEPRKRRKLAITGEMTSSQNSPPGSQAGNSVVAQRFSMAEHVVRNSSSRPLLPVTQSSRPKTTQIPSVPPANAPPGSQSSVRSNQALPQILERTDAHSPAQPMPLRAGPSTGLPLYRFPWGVHKGKTILEVPEGYIPYLKLQGNIEHMEGLKEAYTLFKQGKPPIDFVRIQRDLASVLGTQTTQTVTNNRAQSTAPEGVPAQPFPSCQYMSSSQVNSSANPADYKLNFGKWSGKGILEVPYDYLTFLKDQKVAEGKPGLAAAIAYYERVKKPERSYRLTFGKHKGKTLFDVDADYIGFLKNDGVIKSYSDLAAAMKYFDKATAVKHGPKKTKKRKTTSISASRAPVRRKAGMGAARSRRR